MIFRTRASTFLLLIVFAVSFSQPVQTQEQVDAGLNARGAGQAYLQAVRFRGIDTNVAYFDPTRPPPDLDTNQTPDPKGEDVDLNPSGENVSFLINVISVVVLLGIAFVFLRFGGRFTVSLRQDDEHAIHPVDRSPNFTDGQGNGLSNLSDIEGIEDRKLALVTLAQNALLRAVFKEGLLLQKSWTARDALRRLPNDMNHRQALSDLVAAGEKVLFGGRTVEEEDFQTYLSRIRPLFGSVGP